MTDLDYLAALVTEFVDGWGERIEHGVRPQTHTRTCQQHRSRLTPGQARHHTCRCPKTAEVRVNTVKQPGILTQLRATRGLARTGDDGGSGRTKPGSKPPASLAGADLLNRIRHDVASLRVVLRDAQGEGPGAGRPLDDDLRGLVTLASQLDDRSPLVEHTIATLKRHRKAARVLLGYDAPTRALRDVVCPDCDGTLTVPSDASGDVRCVGPGIVEGPAEKDHRWPVIARGCGNVWRRYQWIDLLEEGQAS